MWDLIVLGDIPGTSIQVTFNTWLVAVAITLGLSLFGSILRSLMRRHAFVSLKIARVLKQEIRSLRTTAQAA